MLRPLVISAVAMAGIAGARPGRVVRVERGGKAPAMPQVCMLRTQTEVECVGAGPVPGDVVVVLDQQKPIAELRVETVQQHSARCTNVWRVGVAPIRGDITRGQGRSLGLIGRVDPLRAHVLPAAHPILSPSGRAEQILFGVDRDGDGKPDLVITRYPCDVSGNPAVTTRAADECDDIWVHDGHAMQRAEQVMESACT
jgi:hypothetical protein